MKDFIFEYSKLKGKMREKNETQETLAKKIGISENSLNHKLNGKRKFTANEIYVLTELLEIKDIKEYFFST